MKPKILVRRHGEGYGVFLTNSNVAKSFGLKDLGIIKVATSEAAEDWIPRLKTFSRRNLKCFLLRNASWKV